jgi:uncharacterized protein
MRIQLATAVAAFAIAGLAATSGEAASFNCNNAYSPTEHAICDNPQIGKLDDQTANLYYKILNNPAASYSLQNQVRQSQRNFISQRDSCGAGYNCLIDAYTDQIMYLKNINSNF